MFKIVKVGAYGALVSLGFLAAIAMGTKGCQLVSAPSNIDVAAGVGLLGGMLAIIGFILMIGGLKLFKYLKSVIPVVAIIMLLGNMGCNKFVPPGHVGVEVNLYGKNRGVQDTTLVTGRVWYNPWTEQIYEFPTFMQYRAWTADVNEGNPVDESIAFVSKGGVQVNVNVAVAYTFEAEKVPELFVMFRQDPDTIADTYIRSRVRDAFMTQGAKLTPIEILGTGISILMSNVTKQVDTEMAPIGVHFDYVSVIGKPRIPDAIQNAINGAIESNQDAQKEMNQVAVVKAQADQAVAEATGAANAVKAKADGDAYATLANAQSQAKANALLSASITPELVKYKSIEAWDGTLPTYMAGGAPLPFIGVDGPPQSK